MDAQDRREGQHRGTPGDKGTVSAQIPLEDPPSEGGREVDDIEESLLTLASGSVPSLRQDSGSSTSSRSSVLRTHSDYDTLTPRRPTWKDSSLQRVDSGSSIAGPSRLAHLDLTIHPSTSEIFKEPISATPPRQGAYSSLPPSPRREQFRSFGRDPLGIPELDAKLARLSPRPGATDLGEVEEYWDAKEATSRRGTVTGANGQPGHDPPVDLSTPLGDDSHDDGPRSTPTKLRSMPSLFQLIRDEAGAEEWEGWIVDGRWERIGNFLAVPFAVERVTLFGALLCLDGFLYNFTVLPIRSAVAAAQIFRRRLHGETLWPIPASHLHSIIKTLLLFIPTLVLLITSDTSKMYHSVRGQDTIKLYVIFNALEIADKLCGAFGQDVLDTLFARDTLAPTTRMTGRGRKRQQARPYFFFSLALGYVFLHTLVFFYMLISLNVAINSYDYTLLSLLISNQFVEIKGSVFKKFDKENLFQIMCADIVERFQLSLMLSVIAIRNMIEMAGSDLAFLPKSFTQGKSLLDAIMSPVVFVIMSEMVVDWLKHAFITKFNHVRASVYGRFTDVLAKDVLAVRSMSRSRISSRQPLLLVQSPLVARRLGFASMPLGCLVLRLGAQAIAMIIDPSHNVEEGPSSQLTIWLWWIFKWTAGSIVTISAWCCLVVFKVLLGLALLNYATNRQDGMDAREAEDVVNDAGRSQVGVSKEEAAYYSQTAVHLSKSEDDLPEYAMPSPTPVSNGNSVDRTNGDKSKRKQWKLEQVERWTMVKRIW